MWWILAVVSVILWLRLLSLCNWIVVDDSSSNLITHLLHSDSGMFPCSPTLTSMITVAFAKQPAASHTLLLLSMESILSLVIWVQHSYVLLDSLEWRPPSLPSSESCLLFVASIKQLITSSYVCPLEPIFFKRSLVEFSMRIVVTVI